MDKLDKITGIKTKHAEGKLKECIESCTEERLSKARKQLDEEPVSEKLDDVASNYVLNIRKGYPRVMDETDRYICNAFKAGAKWQKEQMMEGAVEAEVGASLAKELGIEPGSDVILILKKE